MKTLPIINTHVAGYRRLVSIDEIRALHPMTDAAAETILNGRDEFTRILNGEDERLVVIAGPCSIHDVEAALEYGERLARLKEKYAERFLIMMRVYFEKPRTTLGWKGLINDPRLNNTYEIDEGLKLARKLLISLAEAGLPAATEILDTIIAAYLGELVSWVGIGARTSESQTHRQMASGLSAPVGFKNTTDGGLAAPLNAIEAVRVGHSFLSVNDSGTASIVSTEGNPHAHIVLRGSRNGSGCRPNYHLEDIEIVEKMLEARGFDKRIMVDCSHANSSYTPDRQSLVVRDIVAQKAFGNRSIFGLMLESNLHEGNQKVDDPGKLRYGVSITDPCIGFEETESILEYMATNL